MKKLILFLLLTLCSSLVNGNILNVPGNYSTIQAAINASSNSDTILVEPGRYFENIIFRGKRIVLTSRYYINNDYSFISNTIIDGSSPQHVDSGSVVRIHNGEDSTTVLQGFTITGGTGTRWQDEHGAGRYTEGGGILIALCHPLIQHNIIEDNEATYAVTPIASTGGGGVRLGDGHPQILNNIIRRNKAMYGGGLVSNHSTFVMRNNIVYNNTVYQAVPNKPTYGGGGVWINGSNEACLIENNTIVNNSSSGGGTNAAGKGGGVLCMGVTVTMRNNIIWGNTQITGGQIGTAFGFSTLTLAYNNIQGGFSGAGTQIGNIDLQPQFDSTNYLLKNTSPCIDAGDSSVVFNDPEDMQNPGFAKFPSKGVLRSDIGAYGGPGSKIIANSVVGINNNSNEIKYFNLKQNYPNPFNPETKIEYYIPYRSRIELLIYNSEGKLIENAVNGIMEQGYHIYSFISKNIPSGVYFYKLKFESSILTKKMILLK